MSTMHTTDITQATYIFQCAGCSEGCKSIICAKVLTTTDCNNCKMHAFFYRYSTKQPIHLNRLKSCCSTLSSFNKKQSLVFSAEI